MDSQNRGRSPSASRQNPHRHTPSVSPHGAYRQGATGLGLENTLQGNPSDIYTNGFTNQSRGSLSGQYSFGGDFQSNPQEQYNQPDISSQTFLQASDFIQGGQQFGHQGTNGFNQDNNIFKPNLLDPNTSHTEFDGQFFQQSNNNNQGSIDPSFLDSQLDQSLTSIDLFNSNNNTMATANTQSPTPAHLLRPELNHHSSGNSPHHSPNLNQGAFAPSMHSRHASLDPSTAFGQGPEWG
ncbi:hypothetical protein LTS18_014902, partial [Coniosporium uncinatum]